MSRADFVSSVIEGEAPREPNGCILWPYATRAGYGVLQIDGRQVQAGWLVLAHFEGPRPSPHHSMGHAPHEVCGNRSCIAPEHLSWQTPSEQVAQMRDVDGTHRPGSASGERHGRSRTPDRQVRRAIDRVKSGDSLSEVARDLGVDPTTVGGWVRGRTRAGVVSS